MNSLGCFGFLHEDQCWFIACNEKINQQILIHEIGHIYLDKCLNCLELFKESENIQGCNKEISWFFNYLVDCFNDYHLCKFLEYKRLFDRDHVSKLRRGIASTIDVSLSHFLSFYLFSYITYKSIITEKIRVELEFEINDLLIRLRSHIIKKSKITGKEISQKFFIKLNIKLNNFEKVKDTKDFKTLVKFAYEVLSIIPFWSKKELLEQLSLISRLPKESII